MNTLLIRRAHTITFRGSCPFKLGDEVKSPVTDSSGTTWFFPGSAYVDEISTEKSREFDPVHTLTVTHYPFTP